MATKKPKNSPRRALIKNHVVAPAQRHLQIVDFGGLSLASYQREPLLASLGLSSKQITDCAVELNQVRAVVAAPALSPEERGTFALRSQDGSPKLAAATAMSLNTDAGPQVATETGISAQRLLDLAGKREALAGLNYVSNRLVRTTKNLQLFSGAYCGFLWGQVEQGLLAQMRDGTMTRAEREKFIADFGPVFQLLEAQKAQKTARINDLSQQQDGLTSELQDAQAEVTTLETVEALQGGEQVDEATLAAAVMHAKKAKAQSQQAAQQSAQDLIGDVAAKVGARKTKR